MPKINQEEYEVLKEALNEGYEWIARDEDRTLYAFAEKPVRKHGPLPYWWDTEIEGPYSALELIDEIHLFQFIQWEDEEPHNIAELIEEYEREAKDKETDLYTRRMKYIAQAFSNLNSESEETEVKKDIEWLKEEILGLRKNGNTESNQTEAEKEMGRLQKWAWDNCADRVYELINQLDEPEVLSQEWIDKHSYNVHLLGTPDVETVAIPREDLQNLLVPKQAELEVKIQELIEAYKLEEDAYSNPENGWISGFIEDLKNLVEEEQRYYVLTSSNKILLTKDDGEVRETYQVYSWVKNRDKEHYQLTEQEIKDYDERYWPFAVKVEELEE